MWAWCVSRSSSAPVSRSEANTLVHSSNGRLLVTMAALVALAEHFEQQFGAGLGERHVAEFVDHQQLVAGKLALQPQQSLFVARLDQLVDHGSRCGEADRQAFLAGCQPEAERHVTLPGAAVADRDHILPPQHILRAG